MKKYHSDIIFTIFLVLILFVLSTDQVQSQTPIIDSFQTSINFYDGMIDTRWSTIEAHQLLANSSDSTPEESDLSGYWKAGYNPENQLFYVLIDVKDDTITSLDLIPLDTLYNADHITIYFDLYNDGFSSYSDGYFVFTLFPETDQYTCQLGTTHFALGEYDYIESIDKDTTADGWFVEVLFSFRDLLNQQEVLFIDTIGFEAVITDNDKGFGKRDYRLSWNDANIAAWADPSFMRDIILDQKLNASFVPACSANFDYEIISNNEAGSVRVAFNDQTTTNDELINWSWELGDNSYSFIQDPVHTYESFSSNITTCLYITTKYGCNSSVCKRLTIPPEQYSLYGKVWGNINTTVGWNVLAFQEQGSEYLAIETSSLNGEDFEFTSLIEGNCILYALPDEVDNTYLPTYFVNKYHWQQCDNIMVNGDVYDVDILLNEYSFDISGTGSISGNLQEAPEGIPIVLAGVNGHPLMYTLTNASGEFNFSELPYGTYTVYPEFPGMNNTGQTIILDQENSLIENIVFNNSGSPVNIQRAAIEDLWINYNTNRNEIVITSGNFQPRDLIITIFDSLGRKLLSDNMVIFNSGRISTSGIHSGFLLICIIEGNSLFSKKIIR